MVKILFLLVMALIYGCSGGGGGGGASSSKESAYSSLDLGSTSNTTSDIMVAESLNQPPQYSTNNFSKEFSDRHLNPEPSSLILLTVGLGLSAVAFGKLRRKR
ncbi:MAG: PEP-CTERM sorting domain-containing protein [Candidatus Omnitrophica bacterium]|nr:PEP-CTERM sorting domain-containing protein [Candidatus Omnitrophota bacterium]MCM8827317.1 PEP-CTERM sorting domain-containing protein [Candidatus Omnitrophota bacterium]